MTVILPEAVAQKMAPSLKFLDLLEIFGAEVIATTFLLFFGCIGMIGEVGDTAPMNPLRPAFVWGFTVTACVVIFGPISGAHMNPCVTLSAIIFKKISLLTGLVYFLAEYIGAFFGIWLIKVMTPCANYPEGFCAVAVNSHLSLPAAFLSEFMGTSFLIFAVCSSWDPRSSEHHDSMPIKVGAVVSTIVFGIAGYSNASLNPARSFGPALLYGKWENQWLYWAAPLSASIFTTLLYKYTFLRKYQRLSKNSTQSTNENLSKRSIA